MKKPIEVTQRTLRPYTDDAGNVPTDRGPYAVTAPVELHAQNLKITYRQQRSHPTAATATLTQWSSTPELLPNR